MQAVLQPDPSSHNLQLHEFPQPTPSEDDHHLVAVYATAACRNELDWELQDPHLFANKTRDRIPGVEGSGIVESPPANSSFKRGDSVFFATDAWETGAARPFTLVRTGQLAHKPVSLDWAQGAATPLSALSAWQGLFVHGSLDAGQLLPPKAGPKPKSVNAQRVLITGAAGGVGSWAVKFAHAAGAHVIAMCSGAKADQVREFAAETIDYTTTSVDKWAGQNEPVDLVFDCAGGDVLPTLWTALKDGGSFVTVTADPNDSKPAAAKPRVAKWFLVNTHGNLADIARMIDQEKMTPIVDAVLPFEQFAEVWRRADGRTTGKMVLSVKSWTSLTG